jgi:putative transposase
MARARQLALEFHSWGGQRTGAGRPPNGRKPGVSHLRRPTLSRHHPVHVTLRIVAGVPSLRAGLRFNELRTALARGQQRFGFRLVHFSVQSNHIHLIAEARDRRALSRGMQGLSVRLARAVNRTLLRRGRVFADRYHARALRTPRAAHFALRYVLLNARKHAVRSSPFTATDTIVPGFVDSRSSAAWFDGFQRPNELVFRRARSPCGVASHFQARSAGGAAAHVALASRKPAVRIRHRRDTERSSLT